MSQPLWRESVGSLLVQERSMSEKQKLSKVVLRRMVMLTKQISYKHAQWMKVSLVFITVVQ